jgi:nicotinamidase-related amidase
MPNDLPTIDPATAALVLIDLQKGIVGRQTAPHAAADVVRKSARLADAFRQAGGTVVLVHVSFSTDGRDALKLPVDAGMPGGAAQPPAGWDEFVPEIGPKPGDLIVTKRNWGAFFGTDLDLQLRRRGIATIVLGGIATNIGVESTARQAHERNYQIVFAEDAMTDLLEAGHRHAIDVVFPRIGRVRDVETVLKAIEINL